MQMPTVTVIQVLQRSGPHEGPFRLLDLCRFQMFSFPPLPASVALYTADYFRIFYSPYLKRSPIQTRDVRESPGDFRLDWQF